MRFHFNLGQEEKVDPVIVRITDNIKNNSGQFNMSTSSEQQKSTDESVINSTQNLGIPQWEKIVGVIFGLAFVTALLALSVFIPDPTPSQYVTFKTILALAAAGIGGVLAGTIHVEGTFQKLTVRAGGAIALFVLVFFFSPAPPVQQSTQKIEPKQIIEEGGTGIQHTGSGDINVGIKQ